MTSAANRPDWDIFCAVVDNYGDIGVCWRLARQLAAEHRLTVRLWVDDLAAFQALCPQIDARHPPVQLIEGVEVRHWIADFPELVPAAVVIEAFACHVPERFSAAMALGQPPPVWINLEYLSAEDWVAGCHALSSPHPRLPLTQYFFFPGFTARTGGLLRERDLLARRDKFVASPARQAAFWQQMGGFSPSADTLLVSLFAYENPAIADLLQIWEQAATPVCCLIPASRALAQVAAYCGAPLKVGDCVQRGTLDIRVLPFVPQNDYDALLWACDLNFVRGEDSFVRAQWAAKPMVWQLYPQQEAAHKVKLDAFLNAYCLGLPEAVADSVRRFWYAWNFGSITAAHWADFAGQLPKLRPHAACWAVQLAEQEDLSSALLRFCRSKDNTV
jgi:uncharacterized repeat protein (TIGR03837 family)